GVFGEALHVGEVADMLHDRIRMHQVEFSAGQQVRIRGVADKGFEERLVLDRVLLEIDQGEAEFLPVPVDEFLADLPICLAAAEVQDFSLAPLGEYGLDQASYPHEAAAAELELDA